jgi:hypothetical protein
MEHCALRNAPHESRLQGMEATSGLEPLVQLLQSRALPLGDVAAQTYHVHTYARTSVNICTCEVKRERETGIEPATFSLARRCSTTEPLPHGNRFCFLLLRL